MDDRITDPWGERTPYGRGEEWPVRVDEHLPEGEPERWAQAASVLHSNGDAMDIAVVDGRIAGVRGRAEDRVNRGRLDPKDLYGWQANNSPDRLTRPLVRDGGRLVETDWDDAMGRVVERSNALLAQPGGWGRFGFVPFHYGDRPANELTLTTWDPVSCQPVYKVGAARVEKEP